MRLSMCGAGRDEAALLVPEKPLMWDNLNDRTQAYVVPVEY